MNQFCGRNERKAWTPSDISALRGDIQELKLNVVRVLGVYQKSGIGTVKLHMLDHVADNVFKNERLYLCDAGMYKYLHSIFKQP